MNRTYSGVRGSPRQPRLAGQSTRLPPGVLSSSLVNHCHYSVCVSLSLKLFSFKSARVSAFFYFFKVSANFFKQFRSVRWLCKLFDKALVLALACVALAMCLQMGWLINYFSSIVNFFYYFFINWSLSFFKTKVCNSQIFIIFKTCLI